MIRRSRPISVVWRHVYLTLATLAILMKVAIPPGFMAAAPSNTAPFAIVLCTGQGAMTIQPGEALPGHDEQDKAPAKSNHDMPCAFAGHGLGAPPPNLIDTDTVEFIAYVYRPHAAAVDVAPGRGLTGPPLPARGPPALLI